MFANASSHKQSIILLIYIVVFVGGFYIWRHRHPKKEGISHTWRRTQNGLLTFSVLTAISTVVPWSSQVVSYPMTQMNPGIVSPGGIITFAGALLTTILVLRDRTANGSHPVRTTYLAICWLSLMSIVGIVVGGITIANNLLTTEAGIGISGFFSIGLFVYSVIVFGALRKSGLGMRSTTSPERIAQVVTDTIIKHKVNSEASVADELIKFADLLERGLLSEEEFNVQRRKLLGE